MIVPVSIVSTDGFHSLRAILRAPGHTSWIQNFAERPSKLFNGVEKRLTIWVTRRADGLGGIEASNYRRWLAEERDHLFETTRFVRLEPSLHLVERLSVDQGGMGIRHFDPIALEDRTARHRSALTRLHCD